MLRFGFVNVKEAAEKQLTLENGQEASVKMLIQLVTYS